MLWFCREILPEIRRQVDVQLKIVGRRPTPAIRALSANRCVEVVGEVPDVRPYLDAADIAISPLQLARGIQNKVLEAMASGLPVVATQQSAEGIDAEPGRQLRIAHDAQEFVTAVVQLAQSPEQRASMGAAAQVFGRTALFLVCPSGTIQNSARSGLPGVGRKVVCKSGRDMTPECHLEPRLTPVSRPEIASASEELHGTNIYSRHDLRRRGSWAVSALLWLPHLCRLFDSEARIFMALVGSRQQLQSDHCHFLFIGMGLEWLRQLELWLGAASDAGSGLLPALGGCEHGYLSRYG